MLVQDFVRVLRALVCSNLLVVDGAEESCRVAAGERQRAGGGAASYCPPTDLNRTLLHIGAAVGERGGVLHVEGRAEGLEVWGEGESESRALLPVVVGSAGGNGG